MSPLGWKDEQNPLNVRTIWLVLTLTISLFKVRHVVGWVEVRLRAMGVECSQQYSNTRICARTYVCERHSDADPFWWLPDSLSLYKSLSGLSAIWHCLCKILSSQHNEEGRILCHKEGHSDNVSHSFQGIYAWTLFADPFEGPMWYKFQCVVQGAARLIWRCWLGRGKTLHELQEATTIRQCNDKNTMNGVRDSE